MSRKKMVIGSDETLIKRCSKGDHDAFDILFKKYARPLTHFIFQIIHDMDRAQDIFQDTFLKVLQNAGKFNDQFKFTTWIYKIALNLSINEVRKRNRLHARIYLGSPEKPNSTPQNIIDITSDPDTPENITEKRDMINHVNAALDQLSGKMKTAFILKFYHHFSYEEIAKITQCSIGTAKSRIFYAIEKLQLILGE